MVVAVEVACPYRIAVDCRRLPSIAVDCRRLPWSVLDGIMILAF